MQEDVFTALRAVFGRYKAEWLRGDVFRLFQKPGYFPELEEPRPTALIGGRGTGKTSVLKSLSYRGHFELSGKSAAAAVNAPYVGLYWCIDSNRVTAFAGPELEPKQWIRLFAHYVNLEIVAMFCEYVLWFENTTGTTVTVPQSRLAKVGTALHITGAATINELASKVSEALVTLEASINSVADRANAPLSMQSVPIEYLAEALISTDAFSGKVFYIVVDEFENLDETQQSLFNTLIKHGRDKFAFKIGMKDSGWRTKATLNGEILTHPADYDLIDLSERFGNGQYPSFAREVCEARLAHAFVRAGLVNMPPEIPSYFQDLAVDEEARLLGLGRRIAPIRASVMKDPNASELLNDLSDLDLYYLHRRAESESVSLTEILAEYSLNPKGYLSSYRENYRQSLLFTISEHSGKGLQKYYSGWNTLTKVSGGNIRYLVEIVERAFELHRTTSNDIRKAVSARDQTEACIAVGRKYVQEVQALDPQGHRLTFLLLGLGRLLNLLARHSLGKQPDTTSFVLARPTSQEIAQELDDLLRIAVMHQVLRKWPATKLTSHTEAKESEYSVHPIFAAFFVFPYQKKRRIRISGEDLLLLSVDLKAGLAAVLNAVGQPDDPTEALPRQLSLFEAAYE
ncbi:MAG TPA: hypothetical protein VFJ16_16985 [Longimicrobium sp.]|nr:hypothetical protein [Longimicrobium sp.]